MDGINLWRPNLEMGHSSNYYDHETTLADIHTYSLDDDPDGKAYIGESSCFMEIDDTTFAIHYRLPVSLDAMQAGQYRSDLLAEMDGILQSITWRTA